MSGGAMCPRLNEGIGKPDGERRECSCSHATREPFCESHIPTLPQESDYNLTAGHVRRACIQRKPAGRTPRAPPTGEVSSDAGR